MDLSRRYKTAFDENLNLLLKYKAFISHCYLNLFTKSILCSFTHQDPLYKERKMNVH